MRQPRYFHRLPERFGFASPNSSFQTGGGTVWFHAVSVGEVLSAVELIRGLRAAQPHLAIYLSTTTLAGRDLAEQKLAPQKLAEPKLADGIFFAPLDYRSLVRRVLRRLRPALVVILETEIWPNLYRESVRAGAALVVVNGRISDRALPRYLRARWFFRHALRWPVEIQVQSEQDRLRYVQAGAPLERVRVTGNLKYDFEPASEIAPAIAEFLHATRPASIWIAASTMPPAQATDPDEDDAVLEAFRDLAPRHPRLLLILVPRRPERFAEAAAKLERAGVSFVRRSSLSSAGPSAPLPLPGVLLLDTIGELAALFERAEVVFMGGTLAQRGGHNILEPAYFAKPVVTGPHMENFAAMDAEFTGADALVKIQNANQLAAAIEALLVDPQRAAGVGARARELASARRGVVARTVRDLLRFAGEGLPAPGRTLPARLLLTPLSWIWLAAHRLNLRRQLSHQRSLDTTVISVGGLAMGGAGKSPLVAHLAARLADAGRQPAILTRGYRRKSHTHEVFVPRGGAASLDLTGDEAQIFVRQAIAHLGIGADRYSTGRRMEQELRPAVFLLDDGFQHIRLKRNHDLVLIDAQDPLAGGVFPLGRRREPLESLARATAVIVTRTAPGQETGGIEALVRRYNPRAPVFRSRVVPQAWVDVEWGTSRPANEAAESATGRRCAAFCGLGSPLSFWLTLRQLGVNLAYHWAFGDHHRYRPGELRRLARQASAAGADVLLTTEKDAMNLCPGAVEIVAPLRLWWLRIAVEIDREEELLKLLSGRPQA